MLSKVVLGVSVAVVLGNADAFEESAKKCGTSEVQPRIAVDGQIHTGIATLDELGVEFPKHTLHYVEIICMDEADSTFNTSSGLPVVSVWTKTSPVGQIPRTLEALLEEQNRYASAHGVFAAGLDDLNIAPVPGMELTVWRHEDGWIAEAGVERFLTRCFIYDGVDGSLHKDLSAREPGCIGIQWLGDPSWRPSAADDMFHRPR